MEFPDNWSGIEYKVRHAPVGNRMCSLGNSMAVPVVAWLGRWIEFVDGLVTGQQIENLCYLRCLESILI
jgi:hypothetical protein